LAVTKDRSRSATQHAKFEAIRGRDTRLAALAAIALITLSCGPSAEITDNSPRLVLLYATCSVNKNQLGPYNGEAVWTPHLNEFAEESLVFKRHRTEAGMSGIAYASIFSGAQADIHRVFTHPRQLRKEVFDLTEAFSAAGFEVFYWDEHVMAKHGLHYGQGVDAEHATGRALLPGDPLFQQVLARLNSEKSARALVITAFSRTHATYYLTNLAKFCETFPSQCRSLQARLGKKFYDYPLIYQALDGGLPLRYNPRELLARTGIGKEDIVDFAAVVELLYRSNIWMLDRAFQGILDEIEQADLGGESLVAFTADHGETLYDENAPFWWSHSHTLRADVLDVPLIIRGAATEGRSEYSAISRSIDVYPTLASAAGVAIPETALVQGRDLLGNAADTSTLEAYSHTGTVPYDGLASFGLKVGKIRAQLYPEQDLSLTWVGKQSGDRVWKHRRTLDGEFEFVSFDTASDPRESHDIFDAEDPEDQRASRDLLGYKKQLLEARSASPPSSTSGSLDAEAEEALRSLGYIQ